jgi:hypothetical protein
MDARPCHIILAENIIDTCIIEINTSRRDLADFENYGNIRRK